ncbi:LytR/AlgR family response regulator transcription factor [Marivirga arenosa]|jgi:DNA-binding LytR/AlgR family response regulator|uniref:Response regulator transcription factor n=1 Tax=Marivirga arenosa TaxID=3059076 RepID=A0AA51ZXF6_9BACT|nr:response regulator transcription factor [Marivirga sp. BKB1-2]WNB18529.1 response regulator transcription factor [Marivirga sp. BKB1-2]
MNSNLKCIIIDDEPFAQDVIEKHCEKIPFVEVLKKSNNAIEGLKDIETLKPDLVFMDIQMPTMNGIELIKILNNFKPKIIITTASKDHALEGYELDVSDYLLKPISFERFFRAVNKVYNLLKVNINSVVKESNEQATSNSYFWAKVNGKLLHINFEDVLLVKGMKDYVQIFLRDRKIITYLTMKRILEILPENEFMRVSRSYIVKISSIRGINGNILETVTEEEIIIGSTYRDIIKHEANKWLK